MGMKFSLSDETKTAKIKTIDTTPADTAYRISTVAPTSTKSITSAPTQSLLNFADNRFATFFLFCCKAIPIVITAIKDANGMTDANSSSNVTNKKETHTRIITFEVSLI